MLWKPAVRNKINNKPDDEDQDVILAESLETVKTKNKGIGYPTDPIISFIIVHWTAFLVPWDCSVQPSI